MKSLVAPLAAPLLTCCGSIFDLQDPHGGSRGAEEVAAVVRAVRVSCAERIAGEVRPTGPRRS